MRAFHSACLCVVLLAGPAAAQPLRPDRPPAPPVPPAAAPAAGYLGLTADTALAGGGVEVLSVEPGGPAHRASFRAGDVIEKVAARRVDTVDDLGKQLAPLRVGEKVRFEVRRGLALLELTATLGPRPAEGPGAAAEPEGSASAAPASPSAGAASALLGVVALPLDPVTAARLGLPVRRGALVDQLIPNSPAEAARIPLGAVIVRVDDARVDSPADLRQAVERIGAGKNVTLQYYEGTALRGVRLALGSVAASAGKAPVEDPGRAALLDELRSMRRQLAAMQERIEALERQLAAP